MSGLGFCSTCTMMLELDGRKTPDGDDVFYCERCNAYEIINMEYLHGIVLFKGTARWYDKKKEDK